MYMGFIVPREIEKSPNKKKDHSMSTKYISNFTFVNIGWHSPQK